VVAGLRGLCRIAVSGMRAFFQEGLIGRDDPDFESAR
jgi:hypothetical protein